jgi:hypothetical protein
MEHGDFLGVALKQYKTWMQTFVAKKNYSNFVILCLVF